MTRWRRAGGCSPVTPWWTVVRGSDLEEGPSQGVPVWSEHVGDPILASNITRRADFALFMGQALANDELIGQAQAIVGCQAPSALAHTPAPEPPRRNATCAVHLGVSGWRRDTTRHASR